MVVLLNVTGTGVEADPPHRSWQAFSAVNRAPDGSETVVSSVVVERLLPAGKFRVSQWTNPERPEWDSSTLIDIFNHEISALRSWGAVKKRLADHFAAVAVRDFVTEARHRDKEARAARRQRQEKA